MPWKPFLSVESDWFKFRNSILIIWKRLGIVRTTFEKNRYQRGDHRTWFQILWSPLALDRKFQMPWKPFLSVESDWFKFRNSILIIWKRLGIVRTTFEKNRYQRGDHRTWFQILWSPLALDRKFQMPWKPFLSVESDWFKFRNSILIIWKRLGIVRTTFEKNRYQRGDHRTWFQILWSPLALDRKFQMHWKPFLSVESDWFKFRNSILIIWKRLGIVRTTFEKNRYQRGDHRTWFQILWSPLALDRKFSNAVKAVFICWKWLV